MPRYRSRSAASHARSGIAVLCAWLLLTGTSGGSISARQRQAGPGRVGEVYLALGDSLAAGSSTSRPASRGYVPLYRDLLAKVSNRPITLKNLGVPGETVSSLIYAGQLAAAEQVLRDERARGRVVSPITVDIGGNDLRALSSATDAKREAGLADFRRDIAILFDRLLLASTIDGQRQSDIFTMTIYNPFGGDPTVKGSDAWWVDRFNQALSDAATERALGVAPVADGFRGQENRLTWMPADFHPNNAGHRQIAETLWAISGYDRQAPTLEILDLDMLTTPHRVGTLKLRAADTVGVASVRAKVDGQELPVPLYQATLDAYVTYWDGTGAAPGRRTVTISVSDTAGNIVTRQVTLVR